MNKFISKGQRGYHMYRSLILISLISYLIFLPNNSLKSQTQPSTSVLPYPFILLPELSDVALGSSRLTDLRQSLTSLSYRIYDFPPYDDFSAFMGTPKYYNTSILNNTMLSISFTARQDTILEADLGAKVAQHKDLANQVWPVLSPKTMVEHYGLPNTFAISISDSSYIYGITFIWNNIKTSISYTGGLLAQDVSAEVFKICPRIDRIIDVRVQTTIDPARFATYRISSGMEYIDISDAQAMDFFINPIDRSAEGIGNILLQEGCIATKATHWRHFDTTMPTWTPWPGYTDTPTPTSEPTL